MDMAHIISSTKMVFYFALLTVVLNGALGQFHKGQCPKSGRQCNGCQLVDDCGVREGGLYVVGKTPAERCAGSEVCDAMASSPRCHRGATCRYKKFICPQNLAKEEVFPDAYSCVEYHVCKNGRLINYSCGPKQIFDPKTKRCVATEIEGCAVTTVPFCKEAGTKLSVPNTDYEYVCMEEFTPYHVIYPKIVVRAELSTAPHFGIEQYITTKKDERYNSFTCNDVGYFADPDDCYSYYVCYSFPDNDLASVKKTCRPASYFDDAKNRCVAGSCNNNSYSTYSTTSTPPPTKEKPFQCSSEGYFPVPGNCREYYICYLLPNNSFAYVEGMCRPGSHFDVATHKCVAGDCTDYSSSTPERSTSTTQQQTSTTTEPVTTRTTATTTTLSATTAPPSTTEKPFQCSSEGYFPVPANCREYYICYLLPNNSFAYVEGMCRPGSHFDVATHKCVAGDCTDYSSSTPERSTSTTQQQTSTTTEPVTTRTTATTTTLSATTAPPSTTEKPFQCSSEGYFPVPANCREYYICYLLPNNSFAYVEGMCRPGSHFDVATHKCVAGDCTDYSSSTPEPSTSTTQQQTSTTTEPVTTRTTATTTTLSATTAPPSTTEKPFRCSSEGYFPVAANCREYYICYLLPNNSFAYVEGMCRPGSHFDVATHKCVAGDCTDYSSSTPEPSTSTTQQQTSTTTEPVTTRTTATTTTLSATTAPPSTTEKPFRCSSEGYFPVAANCREYYICYLLPNNSFAYVEGMCRPGSHFDVATHKCVAGDCTDYSSSTPERSTSTTQQQTSTTTEPVTTRTTATTTTLSATTAPPSTTEKPFQCSSEGYFPVPANCREYYICYLLPNNSFAYVEGMCRPGSHFDVATHKCVAGDCTDYSSSTPEPSTSTTQQQTSTTTEPVTTRTTATTTTLSATTAPPSTTEKPFQCSSEGYFPVPANCREYYICYLLPNNSFAYVEGMCRPGSHFDVATHKCVAGDCTDYSSSTPERSTSTTQQQTSTTTEPVTTRTTATTTTLSATTAPPSTTEKPFQCSSEGYFPVPGNCREYYFCYLLPNNSFAYVEGMCRPGSHFDAAVSRCVAGSCVNHPTSTPSGFTMSTSPPVSCSSEGAFEDKGCCKCYYICYRLGGGYSFLHNCCRDGSHFDLVQKLCTSPDTCYNCADCPASVNCLTGVRPLAVE